MKILLKGFYSLRRKSNIAFGSFNKRKSGPILNTRICSQREPWGGRLGKPQRRETSSNAVFKWRSAFRTRWGGGAVYLNLTGLLWLLTPNTPVDHHNNGRICWYQAKLSLWHNAANENTTMTASFITVMSLKGEG